MLYVLVAALVLPTSLFAADERAAAPAEPAAPTTTGPVPPTTAPAPAAGARPGTARARRAGPQRARPRLRPPPAAPTAPAPAQPEVQKLDDETPRPAAQGQGRRLGQRDHQGLRLRPGQVTVNVGDTVTWTNQGPTAHSATATDGAFDTGILDAGPERLAHLRHGGHVRLHLHAAPEHEGHGDRAGREHQGGSGDTTGGSDTLGHRPPAPTRHAADGPVASLHRNGRARASASSAS